MGYARAHSRKYKADENSITHSTQKLEIQRWSFDKSYDVSSLQRARREKAAVGGGSKPVYNYNPWAPEPHLFSATFNVTSTATQFILTASSSAGMAAIRDVVSSAIATAMDNDTYTSTPKNVQIVSNNNNFGENNVINFSGDATIGEHSNGDVTKTTTSPTCTNTQVPSSTTSSQTLETTLPVRRGADDVDTVEQWQMFTDPRSNPYPDPVYIHRVDSLGFAQDLKDKAWQVIRLATLCSAPVYVDGRIYEQLAPVVHLPQGHINLESLTNRHLGKGLQK